MRSARNKIKILTVSTPSDYLEAGLLGLSNGVVPMLAKGPTRSFVHKVAARLGVPVTEADPGVIAFQNAKDRRLRVSNLLSELKWRLSPQNTPDARHLVISTTSDAAFVASALVFSMFRSGTYIELGDEEHLRSLAKQGRYAFVSLMGSVRDINYSLVERLKNIFGSRTHVAIMPAYNPERLSALVGKTILYQNKPGQESLLLAPALKFSTLEIVNDFTIATGENATADLIKNVKDNVLRVLSFLAHGRTDYIRLSNSLVCPWDQETHFDQGIFKRAIPACQSGFQCIKPELDRIPIHMLPAQVVFANSCLTAPLANFLFGEEFAVALRFLSEWAAIYVASPTLKEGLLAENLLFTDLVLEGHPIAHVVSILNTQLSKSGLLAPNLVVFGDPEFSFAQTDREQRAVSTGEDGDNDAIDGNKVRIKEHKDLLEITVSDELPQKIHVHSTNPHLVKLWLENCLGVMTDPPQGGDFPLSVVTYIKDGSLVIKIFSLKTIRLESPIRFIVGDSSPWLKFQALQKGMRSYQDLQDLGVSLGSRVKQLSRLGNEMAGLTRLLKFGRIEANHHRRILKALDKWSHVVTSLDQELLVKLLKLTNTTSFHFVETYLPNFVLKSTELATSLCPYCGETMYTFHLTSVRDHNHTRVNLQCPVCGAVKDYPDQDLLIEIVSCTPISSSRGLVKLKVANASDHSIANVGVGVRISRGKQFDIRTEPDAIWDRLEPGNARYYEFSLLKGARSPAHSHLVRAYVVSSGRVYFAGCDTWINPEPSSEKGGTSRTGQGRDL